MKLNKQQQQLVTDNFNLTYDFQHKYGISEDDFDLLMIGLCKAALTYDDTYAFSTYAYKCMLTEIFNEVRKDHMYRIPPELIVSYNKTIDDDDTELIEIISNSLSEYNIDGGIIYKEISELFNDEQNDIFKYLILGYTQVEIGKIMGVTKQRINQKVEKMRDIVTKYLNQ
jgi:RNA polymerase sigma factor (sigma-70 family)